jgi:hypothetical protein
LTSFLTVSITETVFESELTTYSFFSYTTAATGLEPTPIVSANIGKMERKYKTEMIYLIL